MNLTSIEKLADETCQKFNCRVYDLEYIPASRILRLYIDKDGGVSLDDCSNVSREFSELLDQTDWADANYELEVSSPGLERPLKKPWHYQNAIGKKIQVKLLQALGNYTDSAGKWEKAKNLDGTLKQVEADKIQMDVHGSEFWIDLKAITKASLVFEMKDLKD